MPEPHPFHAVLSSDMLHAEQGDEAEQGQQSRVRNQKGE